MSKREEFISFVNEFKIVSPTISNEQRKGLLRRAVQEYDLSVNEAVEILKMSGIVIGEKVNYFEVLALSIDQFQNQSEGAIAADVEQAHKRLYRASLNAGGRVRSDGRTEEQWRTILNQARDILSDPKKRYEHIAELSDTEGRESNEDTFLNSNSATAKPPIQARNVVITAHEDIVYSVVFSPDGTTVASGGRDKTVCMSDTITGKHKNRLIGHKDTISSVAYSPDSKTIASASYDKTVRLWDADTGQCQNTFTGHKDTISSVAYSPDGKTIASASYDKTVRLWDADTGELKYSLTGHKQSVSSVVYSPDDKTVLSTCINGTVFEWNTATGESKIPVTGHLSWISAVAYSPDGTTLACGTFYGTVYLLDTVTGQPKDTFSGHASLIKSLAYSPDGNILVGCSANKEVRLWNLTS